MDDAQLRALAEAFYDDVWAEHARLPTPRNEHGVVTAFKQQEHEFWTNQYLGFARAVWAATLDEADARGAALRHIQELVTRHYDRLTPHDKMLGIDRVLRDIVETARAAIRAADKKD